MRRQKILIVNRKNRQAGDVPDGMQVFRVDRSTPLGNPFEMNGERERESTIAQYRFYFLARVQAKNDRLFNEYLETLLRAYEKANIALECWCAPKRCHAEVIAKYLEEKVQENERCGNGG